MGTLVISILTAVVGFLAARWTRRRIDVDPSRLPPSARESFYVERVEAPASRPLRVCGRKSCRKPIVKEREGDEMVVRIEGHSILYLHGDCSDSAGEPLP